jgi:hypothetical protein
MMPETVVVQYIICIMVFNVVNDGDDGEFRILECLFSIRFIRAEKSHFKKGWSFHEMREKTREEALRDDNDTSTTRSYRIEDLFELMCTSAVCVCPYLSTGTWKETWIL